MTATYDVPERLDISTAPIAEKALNDLADNDEHQTIVCNFAQTVYISSAGLRVMLALTKRMRAQDRDFILCKLQDQVRDVFDIAGFSAIMDIRDTAE